MDVTPDLVSVVIPARNAAPWVARAVESVVAQSHAPIEIVLADNGSTDDTVAAARAAGPVRVVQARRRGPSAARNAGLAAAHGAFVQFVDADDLLAPDKIARQLQLLRRTGGDVAWGSFTRFDDPHAGAPFATRVVRPALGADLAADLLRAEGFLHVGAALFRRSALGAHPFDESQSVVEDVRMLLTLALAGAHFVRDDGPPGYALREHDSPGRASRTDDATFYGACVANARLVRDAWHARGERLTPERVSVLSSVFLFAAEVFAGAAPEQLEGVLSDAQELDPHFRRRLRRPHRDVVPLLGYRRTFALAASMRRVRDLLRRR